MSDDNWLLDELLYRGQVESHEHIWRDGEYHGCMVTYAHPYSPEMKTMFHPYVPLTVTQAIRPGEPITPLSWPKLTREYFIKNGLSVPGENDAKSG
jgi:hypothetical protein